jgi:outer membrane protein OmpA-like peptidoglycan-associated protein
MQMLPRISVALIAAVIAALIPVQADAQIVKRLRRAATNAVESEAARRVDRLMRDAVRCVFDDSACIEKSKQEGKPVVLTDDGGEVLTDADGNPITDPAEVEEVAAKPGTGAWANYDFVPGEDILFYEDFSNDNVGDFPRRMTFVSGNWEIVEWEGRRLLRNTGPRYSAFQIPLPRTLPERFTIEMDAYFPHGNQQLVVATSSPEGRSWVTLTGNVFQIGVGPGTGVTGRGNSPVQSLNRTDVVSQRLVPVRIMVDGTYAKVFVEERRVANVPNAEFARGDRLHIENTYFADDDNPMLIGNIRIAGGGRDLYDVLEAEGRVATKGILFATGSARIRPESTPTLEEIGTMLREHADLRLAIEGHTDDVGEDAANQALSEARAAAIKTYMVETFGIAANRLSTAGFGESRPAVPNDSPEARQQNRRVELVRVQ